MDLTATIDFPYCRFALRLWCDDDTERIAEFATRAMRVAVNKLSNDLESDVQNLVDPPNAHRRVDTGDRAAWQTTSAEMRGDLQGHHIWTLTLDVMAPPSANPARLAEKVAHYRFFVQERLENQAESVHLWRPPPSPLLD